MGCLTKELDVVFLKISDIGSFSKLEEDMDMKVSIFMFFSAYSDMLGFTFKSS